MSIKTDLANIKSKLQDVLNRSNTELAGKGANTVPNLNALPDAIKSIATGGGGSDVELVEVEGGAIPKFSKTTGSVEIWGWGEGPKEGYTVPRYFFEGKTYRTLAYGLQPPEPLNLGIAGDGSVTGIPTVVNGKFLAVRR